MKLLSKEDIEDSLIHAVVGVATGAIAGTVVLVFMWLEFNFVHPFVFVLGTVFMTVAVLIAFLVIVACKYIIRMSR